MRLAFRAVVFKPVGELAAVDAHLLVSVVDEDELVATIDLPGSTRFVKGGVAAASVLPREVETGETIPDTYDRKHGLDVSLGCVDEVRGL